MAHHIMAYADALLDACDNAYANNNPLIPYIFPCQQPHMQLHLGFKKGQGAWWTASVRIVVKRCNVGAAADKSALRAVAIKAFDDMVARLDSDDGKTATEHTGGWRACEGGRDGEPLIVSYCIEFDDTREEDDVQDTFGEAVGYAVIRGQPVCGHKGRASLSSTTACEVHHSKSTTTTSLISTLGRSLLTESLLTGSSSSRSSPTFLDGRHDGWEEEEDEDEEEDDEDEEEEETGRPSHCVTIMMKQQRRVLLRP